jgi:hypothetical protein
MSPYNPSNDPALVLRLDDQSPFRKSDGTPCGDGDRCASWGDVSGHGFNAVLSGPTAPVYRAAALGGRPGLDFGAGGSLTCGNQAALNNAQSNAFSVLIAAVYSPTGSEPRGFLLTQTDTSGGRWYYGAWTTPQNAHTFNGSPNDYQNVFVGASYRGAHAGDFVLIGETVGTPTPTTTRFYVNGLPSRTNPSAVAPYTGGALAVGSWTPGNGSFCWPGTILAVYVWNRALNAGDYFRAAQYVYGRFGQTMPAAAAPYVLVWDGNSYVGQGGAGYLADEVAKALGLGLDTTFNLAWGGKTVQDGNTYAAADVDPLVAALRSATPARVIVPYYQIVNEVNNFSTVQEFADLTTFARGRLAAGAAGAVLGTCVPFAGVGNTNRTALNTLLRSSFVAQAPSLYLADPASDPVFVDGVQNNSPNTY